MKKYAVIGNPVEHSLSPKLHNYWIKKHKINAFYEKYLLKENDLKDIISKIKSGKLEGINITVPFKKSIIPFVDQLSQEANETQSVNTIHIYNNKIIGHNTDIGGFELAIRHLKYDVNGKKVFILGAGGVVPSIICALKKMKASKIIISNRTKEKAENLKKIFPDIEIIKWGGVPDFDMILNATSLGLEENEEIELNYNEIEKNKFFYDVIYNPSETNFLKKGKELGCKTENGKMMFIYQAHQAFTIWHKVMPEINDEVIELLNND